jgi:hypothetical protein
MSTNFCSFVFTDTGRKLLSGETIRLASSGWRLAEWHEDRQAVAWRLRDQEDRSRIQVNPTWEQRVRESESELRELTERLGTPEGQATLVAERRAKMKAFAEGDRARVEAQTRRMQDLLDELSAWKAEPALEQLRQSLIEDAKNWSPATEFRMPEWSETNDDMTAHLLDSAKRRLRIAKKDLDEEHETVARLNEWLAAMRRAFGPEPEGYWNT